MLLYTKTWLSTKIHSLCLLSSELLWLKNCLKVLCYSLTLLEKNVLITLCMIWIFWSAWINKFLVTDIQAALVVICFSREILLALKEKLSYISTRETERSNNFVTVFLMGLFRTYTVFFHMLHTLHGLDKFGCASLLFKINANKICVWKLPNERSFLTAINN